MMRIGLLAAADEARLLGNIAKVLAVTIAPRCRNDEHALVDAVGLIELAVSVRERLWAPTSIAGLSRRHPGLSVPGLERAFVS